MRHFSKVEDPETIQRMVVLIEAAVRDDWSDLKIDWLKSRGWIGFPVPEDHFPRYEPAEEVHRIAEVLGVLGVTRLLAVNLDLPVSDPGYCWEGEATADGLMALANELGPFYFVVTNEDVSFVILCTKNEYHIVSGPPAFVSHAVGGNLDAAKADFVEQAATTWGGSDEAYLLDVLDRYEDLLSESGHPLQTPKQERRKTVWYISVHPKGQPEEVEVIPMGRTFGLAGMQYAFGRERSDPMTGPIQVREEHLKYAWAPFYDYDFDRFDYFVMSSEPELVTSQEEPE